MRTKSKSLSPRSLSRLKKTRIRQFERIKRDLDTEAMNLRIRKNLFRESIRGLLESDLITKEIQSMKDKKEIINTATLSERDRHLEMLLTLSVSGFISHKQPI